jgi:hypothetical protein
VAISDKKSEAPETSTKSFSHSQTKSSPASGNESDVRIDVEKSVSTPETPLTNPDHSNEMQEFLTDTIE